MVHVKVTLLSAPPRLVMHRGARVLRLHRAQWYSLTQRLVHGGVLQKQALDTMRIYELLRWRSLARLMEEASVRLVTHALVQVVQHGLAFVTER